MHICSLHRCRTAAVLFFSLIIGPSIAHAAVYTGATVGSFDIQTTDLAALPNPIRAFPVPAASGMAGATLIYDNFAEGVAFSSGPYMTGDPYNNTNPNLSWVGLPGGNANVVVHNIGSFGYSSGSTPDPATIVIDDTRDLIVNTEGVSGDSRFPYHIPRPGSDGNEFLRVQFVLTSPVTKFGVFLPASGNAPWNSDIDDSNFEKTSVQELKVLVQGDGQSLADAQVLSLAWSNQYCPFLEVNWNGSTLIKSVTVIQDSSIESSPPLGYMDIYTAVPEPASASLFCIFSGLALLRRRMRT